MKAVGHLVRALPLLGLLASAPLIAGPDEDKFGELVGRFREIWPCKHDKLVALQRECPPVLLLSFSEAVRQVMVDYEQRVRRAAEEAEQARRKEEERMRVVLLQDMAFHENPYTTMFY